MKVITRYQHRCLRCRGTWASKKKKPIRCGKCKSPYYAVPRKNGRGKP